WLVASGVVRRRVRNRNQLSFGAHHEQSHGTRLLRQDSRPQLHGRSDRQHPDLHSLRCSVWNGNGTEHAGGSGEWHSVAAGQRNGELKRSRRFVVTEHTIKSLFLLRWASRPGAGGFIRFREELLSS